MVDLGTTRRAPIYVWLHLQMLCDICLHLSISERCSAAPSAMRIMCNITCHTIFLFCSISDRARARQLGPSHISFCNTALARCSIWDRWCARPTRKSHALTKLADFLLPDLMGMACLLIWCSSLTSNSNGTDFIYGLQSRRFTIWNCLETIGLVLVAARGRPAALSISDLHFASIVKNIFRQFKLRS